MEPRIQYAQTKDGVSIAFRTLGQGSPLVLMPLIALSHVQKQWEIPGFRTGLERLGRNRMLVTYDSRGSGLSQRNVSHVSIDAFALDLEAVVDRLQLGRFALFGITGSGEVAVSYAALHPERVAHLILWNTYGGLDRGRNPEVAALRRVREQNWELYTQTVAN